MTQVPAHWPDDLRAMQGAWHAVTSGIAEARATKKEATVAGWRDTLSLLVEKRAALVAAGEWHAHGPADLLTIAGYGRTEVAHTAILGWLLGPAREHGLGSALLDGVLGEVGLPPISAADRGLVRVTTEEVRQHRRADIVVRFPGRVLVIEAKVDADESAEQCNDLYALFGEDPDAVFVFLTPSGRAPTTATGAAAEAFRTLSLRRVRDVLGALIESGAIDAGARGAPAVRTYHQTLEAQFPRRQPMQIDARLHGHLGDVKHCLAFQPESWKRTLDTTDDNPKRLLGSLADTTSLPGFLDGLTTVTDGDFIWFDLYVCVRLHAAKAGDDPVVLDERLVDGFLAPLCAWCWSGLADSKAGGSP